MKKMEKTIQIQRATQSGLRVRTNIQQIYEHTLENEDEFFFKNINIWTHTHTHYIHVIIFSHAV